MTRPEQGISASRSPDAKRESFTNHWNELEGNGGKERKLHCLANAFYDERPILLSREFSEGAFDGGNELEAILNLMFA